MSDKQDVFQRIRENISRMSKSQRKIAAYIETHPDSVPFLTTAQLAKQAGVGEATVIRFATTLGFAGFTEMQRSLQEQLRKRVTTVERLDMAEEMYSEEQRIAYEVLSDDLSNLKQTIQMLDIDMFGKAVQQINEAKSVTIIAFRSSHALGSFLAFYLHLLKKNTRLITESDTMYEQLSTLGSNDLVIGISFSRYTSRTVQALQYVRKNGVRTLAITDSHRSPLANATDLYLIAASNSPSFLDSFVAPLSLINALLIAVARMNKQEITRHLTNMEYLWEMEGIYYPEENRK